MIGIPLLRPPSHSLIDAARAQLRRQSRPAAVVSCEGGLGALQSVICALMSVFTCRNRNIDPLSQCKCDVIPGNCDWILWLAKVSL
ncbi:hypothetical protein GQ53DRAFT_352023 [Thozetella sp. PMI_491]|nr:hypothetical protein GQ53DRAFT_352023 [Thozetella sp. PMI_491]